MHGDENGNLVEVPQELMDAMVSGKTKKIDWLTNTQIGLGAFDVANGAKMELIKYAAKYSPAIKNLGYVKTVELLGKGTFVLQTVVSTYKAVNAWNNSDGDWRTNDGNKWGVTGKATLDVTIGAVSAWTGPIGWAVGGLYFIGDAAGWWGDWGEPK